MARKYRVMRKVNAMSITEKKTALGAYLAALGISSARSAFCLPILTGEKPVPTATEAAIAEAAARSADAKTITLTEAATVGGVSRSTIWRMTKDGTIPVVNIRGKNRVRLADVIAAFASGKAVA